MALLSLGETKADDGSQTNRSEHVGSAILPIQSLIRRLVRPST
jgi:hypothetical protein